MGVIFGVSKKPCSCCAGSNPTPTIWPLSLMAQAASSFQFVPGTKRLAKSYIVPLVYRNARPPLPSTGAFVP